MKTTNWSLEAVVQDCLSILGPGLIAGAIACLEQACDLGGGLAGLVKIADRKDPPFARVGRDSVLPDCRSCKGSAMSASRADKTGQ